MQLTIWPPFSSNPSTRFTVVGEFASAERAAEAARWLRQLMGEIVAEREAQPVAEAEAPAPRTLPEWAAARWLGVAWPEQTPDWIGPNVAGHLPVAQLERLVFVDGSTSRDGAYPADALIEQLGGKALVDGCRTVDDYGACARRSHILIRVSYHGPGDHEPEGRQLVVRAGQFYHLAEGLGALLAYLRGEGCRQVRYALSEVTDEAEA